MITRSRVEINAKYMPTYFVDDIINYYFTSNHPNAFFLDDHDRRMFVHQVMGEPLPKIFYDQYDKWMNSEGPAALFDYFLKLDIKEFQHSDPALKTEARQTMITDGKSDLAIWVYNLKLDPESTLCYDAEGRRTYCDILTTEQLLKAYERTVDDKNLGRVKAQGIGIQLRSQFYQTKQIKVGGSPKRFWVMCNQDKWCKASNKAIKDHWENRFPHPENRAAGLNKVRGIKEAKK